MFCLTIDLSLPLKDPGQPYPFELGLALEPTVVLDDPVAFSDVHVAGECTGTSESVAMRAVATATVTSRCARCLEPAVYSVRAELDNVFARAPELDQYAIDGYTADIDKPVTDALLLELPIRFLCKPDCRGLCPSCGANLNEGECAHSRNAD